MGKCSAQIRQWIAATVASTGLFMTGMFVGWPSPTVSKLHAKQMPLVLTEAQVSWMISLLYVGGVLSPLAAGRLMDSFGRQKVLRATSAMALASWLLVFSTSDVNSLYLSRVLGGMWGGISYCITPVYLSEIAEPSIRGALNTMFTTMIYLGIMFQYCIGPLLSYNHLNIVSAIIPVIYLISMSFIPESPYYFVMKCDKTEARNALTWLRCRLDVEEELKMIESAINSDLKNKGRLQDLVLSPGLRKALFITEMVAFLQRMSGSSVIMAYISSSVPEHGMISGDQCAIIMCSVWLVFGVWSTFLVDRLGRRPLLAFSCSGCTFATAGLTIWFYLLDHNPLALKMYEGIPFICFSVYAVFFPLGLSCIPSIIQGEMFPSNIKGLASGLTAVVIGSVSFVNNKVYQTLSDSWGVYTNYLYFTISSAYGLYFALFIMIETRNKTLHEIQLELMKNDDAIAYH